MGNVFLFILVFSLTVVWGGREKTRATKRQRSSQFQVELDRGGAGEKGRCLQGVRWGSAAAPRKTWRRAVELGGERGARGRYSGFVKWLRKKLVGKTKIKLSNWHGSVNRLPRIWEMNCWETVISAEAITEYIWELCSLKTEANGPPFSGPPSQQCFPSLDLQVAAGWNYWRIYNIFLNAYKQNYIRKLSRVVPNSY